MSYGRGYCAGCGKHVWDAYLKCYQCSRESSDDMVRAKFEAKGAATPKGVCVEFLGAGPVWLPLSKVTVDDAQSVVWMPRWLAEKHKIKHVL
jgi:hypothetical protein